jgi:hypothetical protein
MFAGAASATLLFVRKPKPTKMGSHTLVPSLSMATHVHVVQRARTTDCMAMCHFPRLRMLSFFCSYTWSPVIWMFSRTLARQQFWTLLGAGMGFLLLKVGNAPNQAKSSVIPTSSFRCRTLQGSNCVRRQLDGQLRIYSIEPLLGMVYADIDRNPACAVRAQRYHGRQSVSFEISDNLPESLYTLYVDRFFLHHSIGPENQRDLDHHISSMVTIYALCNLRIATAAVCKTAERGSDNRT